MKIKDFISELQKYPNQDAEINFVANLIDAENDAFDVENCKIECFQQDVDGQDSYDICVFKENVSSESKLHDLLEENRKLTIKLDTEDKYANIVVLNENENVLREIQVGGRHYQHENIVIILSNIL